MQDIQAEQGDDSTAIGSPEGRSGHEQAADAKYGNGEEVHHEDRWPWVQARQKGHRSCGIPAAQAQVVEAGLPHLLMCCASLVAEHLRVL